MRELDGGEGDGDPLVRAVRRVGQREWLVARARLRLGDRRRAEQRAIGQLPRERRERRAVRVDDAERVALVVQRLRPGARTRERLQLRLRRPLPLAPLEARVARVVAPHLHRVLLANVADGHWRAECRAVGLQIECGAALEARLLLMSARPRVGREELE